MRDAMHSRRAWCVGLTLAALAAAGCPQGPTGAGLGPRVPEWERPSTAGGAGPLAVTFGSPQGQTWTPTEIAVGFSKPMVSLDRAGTADTTRRFEIEPAIEGEYRWLGSQVLTFVPARPLPLSSSFTVTVPAGVQALDGSALAEAYSFSFETPRVRVARSDPWSGTRWRKPQSPVDLWFNQPVEPAELERRAWFAATTPDGATVEVRGRAVVGRERGRAEPEPGVEPPADEGELEPRHLVLTPVEPLPHGADVTLTVSAELRGAQGNLPMGEPYQLDYSIYGDFFLQEIDCSVSSYGGCSPAGGFHLEFSNPVKWGDVVRHLRIAPEVRLPDDPEWADDGQRANVYVAARLQPETTYKVSIEPGLKDVFGQTLGGTREQEFRTGSYPPLARLDFDGGVLEAEGPHRVAARFRNVESATLRLRQVTLEEYLESRERDYGYGGGRSSWFKDDRAGGIVRSTIRPGAPPNQEKVVPIQLDAAFRGARRGIVAIDLRRPRVTGDYSEPIDTALVRVTDLGLTVKESPRGILVWVTSLRSGRPVSGARVRIFRGKNELWSATTAADGLVLAPESVIPDRQGYYRSFLTVVADRGDDLNFVDTNRYGSLDPWAFGQPFDPTRDHLRLVGTVFADRGIYRPGDTVHLKGIARDLTDDGMSTPADQPVEIKVWDGRGEELTLPAGADLRTSPFGSFDFDLTLPPDAPLGWYQVQTQIGASRGPDEGPPTLYGSFRVAEYKAPTFAVQTTTERDEYVRGETLAFEVRGEYLFGAPMAAAEARWWVTRAAGAFAPRNEEWAEYWYGEEEPWWEEAAAEPDSGSLGEQSGRLDASGSLAGRVPLELPSMRGPARVTVEGEVTDLDRSTVAARRTVTVHPAAFYLGARRAGEGLLTAGQDLEVDVIALTPDEQLRAGVAVRGRLYRREWHTVRQEGLGGHYDYVTRPEDREVGACDLTTGAAPVRCRVTVPKPGDYVLQLEATDERGNPARTTYETWAAGAGAAGWYRGENHRMELKADKAEYRPGDTAKVLVQSPFPEAEALLTVEREGLLVRRSFHVTGGAPVVEVPILETYRPNVYLSVLLVRGRVREEPGAQGDDPGKPAFAMGLIPLAVETASRKLDVVVTPDRPETAPGGEVRLDVAVRDAGGAGMPAEVTVYAVDEAVLQLTGYEPPDLLSTFWGRRAVSVSTLEGREELIDRRAFSEDKGEEGGGGGGPGGGTLRTDFRTVAYWNPDVLTDADGKASVTFRLPENLTTFTIFAVAATQGDRFGFGKSAVRTVKPLLLRPALPRFARTDDRFSAGVVVTNRGGPAGDAVVTCEVEGLRLVGEASRTVRLEPGRSREVRFDFATAGPGQAVFRFRVRLGDLEDGLETKREIKLPMIPETVATYGETLAKAVEAIGQLDRIRSDVGGLTVGVSSSALTGLQPAIDHLLWYPYECTEQLASRIVPLVALRELCDGLGLALPGDSERIVRTTIAEIAHRQRYDGGFGFWPDSPRSDAWLTGWVVWSLRQAEARGFDVSGSLLSRALDFLHDALRRAEANPQGPDWIGPTTRAFLVFVLADAGDPEPGFQEALFDDYEALPLFGRALLAQAYVRSSDDCAAGDCPPVIELRRDLENHAFQTAEEAHFEENWGDLYRVWMGSDQITNSVALDTLLTLDVDHPLATKLVRWLLEERDGGRWSTTQSSAWALVALAHFYRVRESETPDFTATLDFGGERLLSERFEGRPDRERTAEIPMSRLFEGRGDRIEIERQGTAGRLYYSLALHYARSDLPRDGIDRGFYLERSYEVVDLAALRTGAGVPRPAASVPRARAGDLVRIQLSIVVPQERSMVVVEDPLPAGLESIDFDLRTTSLALLRAASGYDLGDNDPYGGYGIDTEYDGDGSYGYYGDQDWSDEWWWSPFYHREDRDDRLLLFADNLPAGVHHYEYLARAVTPGTYVVGPLRAEEMYNPEVFGRTGVIEYVVEPPAE